MQKNVQMSLFDIYENISTSIEEKKPELISLLDENIDFDALISHRFYSAFYSFYGRKHKYHLVSFIKALILEKLMGFNDSQLILVLKCSRELRDFCEFDKVPDASYFTRFKQNYGIFIAEMFEALVDITEPICREINEKKADYLIYDTTGIELKVAENNPKFFNTKLRQTKADCKGTSSNPYMSVYKTLPDFSATNPSAKQQYINGHYCYALKTGIVTNGIGIVRHISVFDDSFKAAHPETVTQKSDNPDIDKEIGDSVSLKPVLSDFFGKHKSFYFKTFISDSSFNSYDNYSLLKNDLHFQRACIPLNPRNSKTADDNLDEHGTPVCPIDKTPFIYLGKSGGKNRSERFKWVCQKSVQKGNTRICICDTPCTTSSYGKCTYTYPNKNFRLYPGIPRNTEHWDNLYKHRVVVERTINIFKDSFGISSLKSHNTATVKSDLYLAGITQLVGVLLAKAIHKPKLFKSVRKIVTSVA